MKISKEEVLKEEKYLKEVNSVIKSQISEMGQELYTNEERINDFKKYLWNNKSGMDKEEIKSIMTDNDLEVYLYENKSLYFEKLYRIQNSPYFASIVFKEDNMQEDEQNIYIGITHLKTKEKYYIHDWRAPICSLFYDFEVGEASFYAPSGYINGELLRKRQYKISDGRLIHVFDNSINMMMTYFKRFLQHHQMIR